MRKHKRKRPNFSLSLCLLLLALLFGFTWHYCLMLEIMLDGQKDDAIVLLIHLVEVPVRFWKYHVRYRKLILLSGFLLAYNTFCAVCCSGACDFHKVSFCLFFLLGIVKLPPQIFFIYLVYLVTLTTAENRLWWGSHNRARLQIKCALLPSHDRQQKTHHITGNYKPYSLRQVCGFFYVPQDCKHWSNAALSPQLSKDPECWSGRSWTHDLPRDSPVLNQLNHRCFSKLSFLRIDETALWRISLMAVVFFYVAEVALFS